MTKYPTICQMIPVDNRAEFFRRVMRTDFLKKREAQKKIAKLVNPSETLKMSSR